MERIVVLLRRVPWRIVLLYGLPWFILMLVMHAWFGGRWDQSAALAIILMAAWKWRKWFKRLKLW